MKQNVILLFGGFLSVAATPAWGINSYNKVSAIIERQGYALAGMIREFVLYDVPSLKMVFAIALVWQLLLILLNPDSRNKDGDFTQKIIMKVVPFMILWALFYNDGATDDQLYSFVHDQQVQNDDYVKETTSYAYLDKNINFNDQMSVLNGQIFYYADLASAALLEVVHENIYGDNPERRLPLLMQRALVVSQTLPVLGQDERIWFDKYLDACQAEFMAHPEIKGRGLRFMDSMKDTIGDTWIQGILESIQTNEVKPTLTPEQREKMEEDGGIPHENYFLNCLEIRDIFEGKIQSLIGRKDSYFSELDRLYQKGRYRNLSEEEMVTVINNRIQSEVDQIITMKDQYARNNLNAFSGGEGEIRKTGQTFSMLGIDFTSPNEAVLRKAMTLYHDITHNNIFGNPSVEAELKQFYGEVPIYYGMLSTIFMVAAELCLMISIVQCKIVYLPRIWLGFFTLKCLPIFWMYLDSVQRGLQFVSSQDSFKTVEAVGTLLQNYDLYKEANSTLVYTTSATVDIITGSFFILVVFIPFNDFARKVMH